eukprot:6231483-Amphidinium_carterae.1
MHVLFGGVSRFYRWSRAAMVAGMCSSPRGNPNALSIIAQRDMPETCHNVHRCDVSPKHGVL